MIDTPYLCKGYPYCKKKPAQAQREVKNPPKTWIKALSYIGNPSSRPEGGESASRQGPP